LWARSDASKREIFRFSNAILESGRAIGTAIVEGHATFAELLDVLDRRRKFREWLASQPFDADLVREYFAAITKQSWLDKLPNKAMRWTIASAAGLATEALAPTGIGIATSLAVSAFDQFLLEKLAKGWRPDQFVNAELKPLTRKAREEPR